MNIIAERQVSKVIKDRINALKSQRRYYSSRKLSFYGANIEVTSLNAQIEEQYWLLHKLGLAKKK